MRIGIDARFLTHPQFGGFKTYTRSLVLSLGEVDTRNEYLLYVDRAPGAATPLPRGPHITVRVVPGSLPLVGMPWREQVALRRAAADDRLDLFHAPCLTAPLALHCPSVVSLLDMIWYRPSTSANATRSAKRKVMAWYYRVVPRLAAQRAAAVITISHAARAEITAQLPIRPERVFVTHLGYGPEHRCLERVTVRTELQRRWGLAGPYLLAIGSADPRKNIRALVEAYAALPHPMRVMYPLVIVWTHNLLAETIAARAAQLGLGEQVRFLTRIDSESLALLYNGATLFVFPSLYEGFGLPPLEAMASGTPVIAADNTSIPEITGEAALLFDARDPSAITSTILRALSNPQLLADMAERGLQQSRRFSWARCAQDTLAAYEYATGAHSQRGTGLERSPTG